MTPLRKRYEKDQACLITLLRGVQDAKATGLDHTQRLFAQFKAALEKMIASEEEVFFPSFDKTNGLAGDGPTAIMRVEHRQIRRLLEEIEEKLLKGDMRTDAEQIVLLQLLRAHQQQERAVVYPVIGETGERPSRPASVPPRSLHGGDDYV